MSVEKKNKDHLKERGGISLVPPEIQTSNEPLQFWTNHPTENTFINLRPFWDGEFEPAAHASNWHGPFAGRPKLIVELAPAFEALVSMAGPSTVKKYLASLRVWWRFLDGIEAADSPSGHPIAKVNSVADLGPHHEAAAHRAGINRNNFTAFMKIADAARARQSSPGLGWIAPGRSEPIRHLISEYQARELKIAIKQDWERVRRTWAMNDKVIAEAERRALGYLPAVLDDEELRRLNNWQYYKKIQLQKNVLLPTGKQLLGDWKNEGPLIRRGLSRTLMRSMAFPTAEDADIAFHLALMNSGWNPSTMMRIDATNPFALANHPKNDAQLVLSMGFGGAEANEQEEVILHADKLRARGRTQFCIGKKSQPSSAPMIVEAYLSRVGTLREILRAECLSALAELDQMRTASIDHKILEDQIKLIRMLELGCRSVWLYLDREGEINWLRPQDKWKRYKKNGTSNVHESYLDRVRKRLNRLRAESDRPLIPNVTPSDFRDIYARWVYVASKGNILAVMLALGHRRVGSTVGYMENNIFAVENDEAIRRWGVSFFKQLEQGRIDLTILAQLVRHGPLTPEMEARLTEYRRLMRSRIGAGCSNPRMPPSTVSPNHVAGRLCGTHHCLRNCPNAKFLPESLDGISMRVEELVAMIDHMPRETFLRGGFDEELESGEELLNELFAPSAVAEARERWRQRIADGNHLIPGMGLSR